MSPRRPHTGCTADVLRVLTRPMTAGEVADALPDRDRDRVQVMLHQLTRKERIVRTEATGDRRTSGRMKWIFAPKEQP